MHKAPLIESQTSGRPAKCQLHAVLVQVFEIGVLIIGESGIGKSECALELITRGHRLAADDVVEIVQSSNGIYGRAPGLTRHLLEIRGLGILSVPEIFGEQAACAESPIDLCIELRKRVEAEPLTDPISSYDIANVSVPKFTLPVSRGRDVATLVETAVRIYQKGTVGQAAQRLVEEHTKLLDSVQ